MPHNTIPQTDLKVSRMCLGTMTFGNPVAQSEAIRMVHWALGREISFIDTADSYEGYHQYVGSAGEVAEELLGKALKWYWGAHRAGNVPSKH